MPELESRDAGECGDNEKSMIIEGGKKVVDIKKEERGKGA